MSVEKHPKLTAKDQWLVLKRLLRYIIPHKKSVIDSACPADFDGHRQYCRAFNYSTIHR